MIFSDSFSPFEKLSNLCWETTGSRILVTILYFFISQALELKIIR